MLVDYFVSRKGNLSISDLFTTSSSGIYYYFHGLNLRAFAAFIIGFILPLPGFIGTFGTVTVSTAASNIYSLGWELSFVIGGVAYFVLGLVWPVPGDGAAHGFETSLVSDGNVDDLTVLDATCNTNETKEAEQVKSGEV